MIIMVIALIVVGPHKLPELARTLEKGLAEFKNDTNDLKRNIEEESRLTALKERTVSETPEKETADPVQASQAAPSKA